MTSFTGYFPIPSLWLVSEKDATYWWPLSFYSLLLSAFPLLVRPKNYISFQSVLCRDCNKLINHIYTCTTWGIRALSTLEHIAGDPRFLHRIPITLPLQSSVSVSTKLTKPVHFCAIHMQFLVRMAPNEYRASFNLCLLYLPFFQL